MKEKNIGLSFIRLSPMGIIRIKVDEGKSNLTFLLFYDII